MKKVEGTKLGEPKHLFEELKSFLEQKGPNGIVSRFMDSLGKENVSVHKKVVFKTPFFGLPGIK